LPLTTDRSSPSRHKIGAVTERERSAQERPPNRPAAALAGLRYGAHALGVFSRRVRLSAVATWSRFISADRRWGSSPPKFAGGPRKGGRPVSARTRAAGRLARVALANGAIIGRASALQPPRCLGAPRHGQRTGVLRTPIVATLLINSAVLDRDVVVDCCGAMQEPESILCVDGFHCVGRRASRRNVRRTSAARGLTDARVGRPRRASARTASML
jgi:hypothetical protein